MSIEPVSIEIIEAGYAHIQVLSALHTACFETGWTEKSVGEILAMPGAFSLIASRGQNPVGFILCTTAADESELVAIGTLPKVRKLGIGRRLLISAMEKVKGQGGGAMFLEVAEENLSARGLYEASGFAIIGRRKKYYRQADGRHKDALILRAILS